MALDARAQSLPVEIEILDKENALRIADVEDRAIPALYRRVQFFNRGRAHIHLKSELAPIASEQTQMLEAGSGADAHLVLGGVRFHQQGRGATRAVAGNLTAAAVGIP